MPRIDDIDPARLSADEKKVYDAVASGPRGRVEGPLRVWVKNPPFAERAQALGAYCRYGSSLPPRLSELGIIVMGAYWKAGFEWYAHAPLAIKGGVDPAAVEAIRVGSTPALTKADEIAVYRFAHELVNNRRVSEPTYNAAKKELGERGVIDLVGILGYYSLISMTINVFEVKMPAGEKDPFADVR